MRSPHKKWLRLIDFSTFAAMFLILISFLLELSSLIMNSSNYPEDDEEFSFFDISETENQNYQNDLWLRLDTGEQIYLGYPDDLCRQCYQREGFNYVSIGECKFLICDDCERRNFTIVSQMAGLIH